MRNENTRDNANWCGEGHDLVSSELTAHRDRDRDFVRILLVDGLTSPRKFIVRLRLLPCPAPDQKRLVKSVDITMRDLRR